MKKRIIALISFLCYIICWAQAADEHYYFKNLSIQDGLSQTTVNAIIQDKKGFMWFGTKGGLSRYDGMSFRNFKRDMTDNHSLGNNFVTVFIRTIKGISGLVQMPGCIFIILTRRFLFHLTV